MAKKSIDQIMNYNECLRWELEEKIRKGSNDYRNYLFMFNDDIAWRINCKRWRKHGKRVKAYDLTLDELNSMGGKKCELIDLSEIKYHANFDFIFYFQNLHRKTKGETIYYTHFLKNKKVKAFLGAIGADALIYYKKSLFSSTGIPVKKINQ